ncbi:MAG: UpxY family transcription antiterminator [Saprospiraceae bacterium]|nr:UpxY family transcription antiterminator [Saprospiraceae bacterium]
MSATQIHTTNQLDEQEARWFAVYTAYKREKLVSKRLADRSIEAYLPLLEYTRRYERKVRSVELPLISGYIFVKITRKEYVPVLETPDVVNFVKFARNLIAIPESEIKIIQRIVGEVSDVEVRTNEFCEGDEVEIIGGKLTGLRGKLLEGQENKNLLIELTHTGLSLRMYIAPGLLMKVQPSGLGRR